MNRLATWPKLSGASTPIDAVARPVTQDYSAITELPGSAATGEQLARLYHRYHTASLHARGRRVLEVACGPGLGLGYLTRTARLVVGGDYTASVLRMAQAHYQGRIPLLRLDAHHLPFSDRAFDLLVVFEAIYYLADAERFVAEARRVLDTNGTLLLCTVNREWREFSPSSFSTRYYSVPGLRGLLVNEGFTHLEFFGAFPTSAVSLKQEAVRAVRRIASAFHLVPKTLSGRESLKRLFYGPLVAIKPEIEDGVAEPYPLVGIPADVPNMEYKIIYALGRNGAPHYRS